MSYNRKLADCTSATDGTAARYECAPFYEDVDVNNGHIRVCRNGTWQQKEPDCSPVCGRKSASPSTISINETFVLKEGYPWQVAIYRINKQELLLICSGSLINQKMILTAAHCVSDFKGKKQPKDNYIAAVGKYYRDFDDVRDATYTQFSKIQEIFTIPEWKGEVTKYAGDIAILVTEKIFKLSPRVQPVCVDWGLRYSQHIKYGYVAGWGYTSTDRKFSEELRELRVPFIPRKKCADDLPKNFVTYLVHDKFCAGYLNRNISLCAGDSGSGLVSYVNGRYYISGIVSVAPTAGGSCNINQYTLYTNVSKYVDHFILDKEVKFAPRFNSSQKINNMEDCVLPEHPKNGRWTVIDTISSPQVPGFFVPLGTKIAVQCVTPYTLDGTSSTECKNGNWEPKVATCADPCPPILNTRSLQVECFFENRAVDCGNSSNHGSLARFKCAPFYENLDLSRNPFRQCKNGAWSPDVPKCVPVCGIKPDHPKALYPWNVGIFEGNDNNFKCAGTLINERIVVTSAQCVSDEFGNKHSSSNYRVAAGKSTIKYTDAEDKEAQYSEIEDIFIPEGYRGSIRKYLTDIAILVTKATFNMTERVQLACVDFDNKFLKQLDLTKISCFMPGPLARESSLERVFEVGVSFVNDSQCYKQLSESPSFDTSYYTSDKLCSGSMSLKKNSQCEVNRGVGLVSNNQFDDRYYLTGIASIFPTDSENCNNQRWVLFTEVSKYSSNFIKEKNKLYTPLNTPYFQSSCGVKSIQTQTLIIHGEEIPKGDYPWQAAIYNKTKHLICGGSLINQRIILTAAHCVTNWRGDSVPKEDYTVAVGKFYRDFHHTNDPNAQFSALLEIFVAPEYQADRQNYFGDIALLITEQSFILSREIQPICVDWENKYESYLLKPSVTGFVTGWGLTREDNNPSQVLKSLEVPYVERDQCKEKIPQDYDIFLTYDKICAGYLNKSKSVCRGDSGGGLVFRNDIDNRYYIVGIVSLSPRAPTATGGCDSQQYSFYTSVSRYIKNFVLEKAQLYWK